MYRNHLAKLYCLCYAKGGKLLITEKIITLCLKSVSKSVTVWNTVGPGFCVQITEKNSMIGLWENLDALQGFISPAFEGMVMSIHEASEVTIIEKIKLSHVRTSVDISTWIVQNIYVSKCLASKTSFLTD